MGRRMTLVRTSLFIMGKALPYWCNVCMKTRALGMDLRDGPEP